MCSARQQQRREETQFGRASKTLSLDRMAPDNKETLKELLNLHPLEEGPPSEIDDYSSYAYQFDETSVFTLF